MECSCGEWQRGKRHHVVLDDHVRLLPRDDLLQLWLAVLGALDERGEGRLDERRQLLDGRLAELRGGLADEVLPELPGVLSLGIRVRRCKIHQILDRVDL